MDWINAGNMQAQGIQSAEVSGSKSGESGGSDGPLSDWRIITAIVLGGVVLLVAIAALIIFLVLRSRKKSGPRGVRIPLFFFFFF